MGRQNKKYKIDGIPLQNSAWRNLKREMEREIVKEAEKILSSPEAMIEGIKNGSITRYMARKIGRVAVAKQLEQMKFSYANCRFSICGREGGKHEDERS